MGLECQAVSDRLILRFVARGVPRPQGSKRLVRGRMIESARGHLAWRQAVALAALQARQRSNIVNWPLNIPVAIDITFYVPGRCHKRPDLDKLVRAVLDSIVTAGVIDDDARIVDLHALKVQAPEACGAEVGIRCA